MAHKSFQNIVLAIMTIILCMSVTLTDAYAAKKPRPFNRIVIMLDSSGSYTKKRMEALKEAKTLVEKVTAIKTKKWEGQDEVIIISLDAMPEVLWSGSSESLKADDRQFWQNQFTSRKDYEGCTDVEGGLKLAANILHQEPAPETMFCFIFSDLIHEPPTSTARKCKPVKLPSVPDKDFPWEMFSDINMYILWMPIDQKLAWSRAIEAEGLSNFAIYSENDAFELQAPEKAKHVITEQEKEEGKQKLSSFALTVLKWVMWGGGALACGVTVLGFLSIIIKRRSNAKRRQGRR